MVYATNPNMGTNPKPARKKKRPMIPRQSGGPISGPKPPMMSASKNPKKPKY